MATANVEHLHPRPFHVSPSPRRNLIKNRSRESQHLRTGFFALKLPGGGFAVAVFEINEFFSSVTDYKFW